HGHAARGGGAVPTPHGLRVGTVIDGAQSWAAGLALRLGLEPTQEERAQEAGRQARGAEAAPDAVDPDRQRALRGGDVEDRAGGSSAEGAHGAAARRARASQPDSAVRVGPDDAGGAAKLPALGAHGEEPRGRVGGPADSGAAK